jgi:hypothetical protein
VKELVFSLENYVSEKNKHVKNKAKFIEVGKPGEERIIIGDEKLHDISAPREEFELPKERDRD